MHTDVTITSQTLSFIEDHHGALLLHAGAAALADGGTVLVAGPTGSGKTTLTIALAGAHLGYVTDETVCLDPTTLDITAFPKPLTIKPGAQPLLARLRPDPSRIDPRSSNWHVDPTALPANGSRGLPDRLRPTLIVLPDYDATTSGVAVTPLSPARAAFLLGEESSALWAVQPRPLAALHRLVRRAPAWALSYSDAFAAAEVIVEELLPVASALDTAVVEDQPQAVPRPGPGPSRADGVDWIVLDAEAVLFDGHHLHHLDAPGCAVWELLDGTRDVQDVADELSERFGAPPARVVVDVEDLVRVLRRRNLVVDR